jgi:hypothetical protein
MDLHAGIAMDVKNKQLFTKHICGYCNGCKKPLTIMRPYIEMALWKL